MKTLHDLSKLNWKISGWTPYFWRFANTLETGMTSQAEISEIPAQVPGSVQSALLRAVVIDDWNTGLNARKCEWVENRHWIFSTVIPSTWFKPSSMHELICDGLDYAGWIYANGVQIGAFKSSHLPQRFTIPFDGETVDCRLQIVFDCPPRWLGQFGYTSQMTDWKPRFNYTWDWTARLVQTGIWDDIKLLVHDEAIIKEFRCYATLTDGQGDLFVRASVPEGSLVYLSLNRGDTVVHHDVATSQEIAAGVRWQHLLVDKWTCNGNGEQPIYTLRCSFIMHSDLEEDSIEHQVGFRSVEWASCDDSPKDADPWICCINGVPTFLQGVNWTPIRPNFADVTDEQYRSLLTGYRDMGCNLLRVWGGGFLEKEVFYNICDELGLLVWQELPLSSSGLENWPPEDPASIEALASITRSYVERRQHHPSLIIWCGGNELQGGADGSKTGGGRPVSGAHPLIAACKAVVSALDPSRRFLPTSSSGPTFTAESRDFGKSVHWDVHGPWKLWATESEWAEYWSQDDALFRSETGAPGASPIDIITWAADSLSTMPCNEENPLWRRMSWWIEEPEFVAQHGRPPANLAEYVDWSQERQAKALVIAASACKGRFPKCGGFLVWMGHDSFPCPANTSIVDFLGRPKPAALELQKVFHNAGNSTEPKTPYESRGECNDE